MNAPEPTPNTQPQTTNTMLEQLIGLLVDPDSDDQAWLRTLAVHGTDEDSHSSEVRKMICLGAVAEIDRSLMTKITVAMVQVAGLAWSPTKIEGYITAIYKDRQSRVEHDRRTFS